MHYLPDATVNSEQEAGDFRLRKIAEVVRIMEKRARRNRRFDPYELRLLTDIENAIDLWVMVADVRATDPVTDLAEALSLLTI